MRGYKAAEEMLLDLRCPVCETLITDFGCDCHKLATYERVVDEVDEWLTQILPSVSTKTRKMLLASAGHALGRQRHRAGFRNVAVVRDGQEWPCTVDDDERAGFNQQHDINTKWQPPRSRLTQRAYSEPI